MIALPIAVFLWFVGLNLSMAMLSLLFLVRSAKLAVNFTAFVLLNLGTILFIVLFLTMIWPYFCHLWVGIKLQLFHMFGIGKTEQALGF